MTTENIYSKLRDSVSYLLPIISNAGWCNDESFEDSTRIGIICGSGLSELVDSLDETLVKIPYSTIPHFPQSSVIGHANQFVFGSIKSKISSLKLPIILMSGRIHCYEGFTPLEAVYPILILKLLGVSSLLISAACGAINRVYNIGDIMILRDHIYIASMCGANPLVGPVLRSESFAVIKEEFSEFRLMRSICKRNEEFDRFISLDETYDQPLSRHFYTSLSKFLPKDNIHAGVYYYCHGPSYETPAEIQMLRNMGADAVGMSTLPEVVMAKQLGIKVIAFALITNTFKQRNFDSWISEDHCYEPNGSVNEKVALLHHAEVLVQSRKHGTTVSKAAKAFLETFPIQ